MKKHALIVGATGATGKDLLDLLLKDDTFYKVDIFIRRDLKLQHDKLKTHVIDFDKPEQWKDLVKGDVLYSCLGTTLKAAGSKDAQWKVDYDYQYEFAKAAKENNVDNYVLVSSGFASADSKFFYTKMKGQLEEAVKELDFAKLSIFQPPMLIRKDTHRIGEIIGLKVMNFLNNIGLLSKNKPMPTTILAQAMINSSKTKDHEMIILQGESIWKCAEAKM